MPQIIARTIADLIAKARTDDELREAIVSCIKTARDGGYSPRRESIYGEVCEELRRCAEAEADPQQRELLTRAIVMIGRISDDSQPDFQRLEG